MKWILKSITLHAAGAATGLILATLSACQPDAVVGFRGQGVAGACGGCLSEYPTSAPGCEEVDSQKRAKYDQWRNSPNDLSAFAGTVWQGRIATEAPATLTIGADLSAALFVGEGERPTPVADKGFLCSTNQCRAQHLYIGGTYPIHGASYTVGESPWDRVLHFDLNPLSPFDEWCRLQTPKLPEGDTYDPCPYHLFLDNGMALPCTVDGQQVDCDWRELAVNLQPCTCTSTGCFTKTIWAPGDPPMHQDALSVDLFYDPEEQSLSGNIVTWQQNYTSDKSLIVTLWRVDEETP